MANEVSARFSVKTTQITKDMRDMPPVTSVNAYTLAIEQFGGFIKGATLSCAQYAIVYRAWAMVPSSYWNAWCISILLAGALCSKH